MIFTAICINLSITLTRENYFLGLEEPDSQRFSKGMDWLIKEAKAAQGTGWVAANNRETIGRIARHPGLGRFAIFYKPAVTKVLIADCIIEIVTRSRIPSDGLGRPMLAVHPTPDFLNMLEAVPNIQKMLVIPWIAEEVDAWAKRYFAKDLENPDLPSIYVDEVAITAFKHLKFAFSESPPKSPAQNRAAICQTLEILVHNNIRFEPSALQSALIQKCGWEPVSAKQVAEISQIFLSDRVPVGYNGEGPWEPEIIKLWKIEAAKTELK